jgi:hypothetical protein
MAMAASARVGSAYDRPSAVVVSALTPAHAASKVQQNMRLCLLLPHATVAAAAGFDSELNCWLRHAGTLCIT